MALTADLLFPGRTIASRHRDRVDRLLEQSIASIEGVEVARRGSRAVSDHDRPEDVEDVPTVACSRCDRQWELSYELDDLHAGNRAFEQFALDHERHTGHYPDDVTPWLVTCRQCPDGEQFLAERPARRWASTHARHTRHDVQLHDPDGNESVIESERE